MTKPDIRAILFRHSTEKNLNASIEDLYKGFQNALGRE